MKASKDSFEDCKTNCYNAEKQQKVLLNGYYIWWCYTHNQPLAWCEKQKAKEDWLKGKQDIWLVWDVDITKGETSLRAVTTTIEKAEKYKKSIEETHKRFDNHQFMVDIEPRDTNHLYGITVLQSIGVKYKKS